MKIAICDDSRNYLCTMRGYFDKINGGGSECDTYESGEELLYMYENGYAAYDAVFLDMEMKILDGIETANVIRRYDSHVIIVFITSHTKYMQKSFECEPFRFLVKPIGFDEFKRVSEEISIKLNNKPETVVFSENRNRIRVFCDDIVLFESRSHWILIHTKSGQIHKLRKTMSEIIDMIDPSVFVRVHRSFTVNINYIYKIAESTVIMHRYESPIPIGRIYKKDLEDKFLNFKERKYLL